MHLIKKRYGIVLINFIYLVLMLIHSFNDLFQRYTVFNQKKTEN